jgi:hypothetical protein
MAMIELVFSFFSNYLIEFMGAMLFLGLVFRWISYRESKKDDLYYSTFAREVVININEDRDKKVTWSNPHEYITDLLTRATSRLPSRSLRTGDETKKSSEKGKKVISLKDFVSGKHGLLSSIQSESSVFVNKTQPDFAELTTRILSQDSRWTKIWSHIPIDGMSRIIDIMPGLFIVFGVFGTFIGISMALPEIAKIDFNDLEASGVILSSFVTSVTYAMKTSIAGIFFSVILTLLNTMFPIKGRRFNIFKKVENSLQQLWYHMQDGSNQEMKMEEVLPRLVEVLDRMDATMKQMHESDHKKVS